MWQDLSLGITSKLPVLAGVTEAALVGGRASFAALYISGEVGAAIPLELTLTSPTLGFLSGATQAFNITVAPCASDEVYDAATKTCGCVSGSSRLNGRCQCKSGTYASLQGPSGGKVCVSCPGGAVCPGALEDGVFAAADFWSPANSTQFYACSQGMCLAQGTNASFDGHCREGHMGVVCGACLVRPVRRAPACLIACPPACLPAHLNATRTERNAAAGACWPAAFSFPLCIEIDQEISNTTRHSAHSQSGAAYDRAKRPLPQGGYTFQGDYCASCPARSAWADWPLSQRAPVAACVAAFGLLSTAVFLCAPPPSALAHEAAIFDP